MGCSLIAKAKKRPNPWVPFPSFSEWQLLAQHQRLVSSVGPAKTYLCLFRHESSVHLWLSSGSLLGTWQLQNLRSWSSLACSLHHLVHKMFPSYLCTQQASVNSPEHPIDACSLAPAVSWSLSLSLSPGISCSVQWAGISCSVQWHWAHCIGHHSRNSGHSNIFRGGSMIIVETAGSIRQSGLGFQLCLCQLPARPVT